ncbi:MAG: hypothetical protein HY646_05850, partial [Acidobacteria bacterium]|nr:hypothetical protein [Acidobacteriota bacterium]
VCHEPGHRSWQMGRAFTLRFHGLAAYAGETVATRLNTEHRLPAEASRLAKAGTPNTEHKTVTVHLHAYDYDCLGRSYSVRLSQPETLGGRQVELLRTTLPLPQGRAGRDDPKSLNSFVIPAEFLAKPFFNLHIIEGYDSKNIDLRKQVPYSVAISDVWVTARKNQ